jgi:TRAP-type mannitol/chloroaromatic compound transport system substrate-binding protein
MKKTGGVALALGAALAVGMVTGEASAQQTWTMTTTWPSSLELIEMDKHWAATVEKLVGDELKIEFFDGGTLVPSTQVFDAVSAGDIQAGGDWPGYWAGRNAAFAPLATHTMLFNAVDYVNWIKEWGGAEFYNDVYGQYNMVYLPYGVTNNESGFRTNQPIASLEDLKGKRLRLSGRDQGKVLERLGGSQVPLAGQEIYQALERGVIDGAEFSVPGVDFNAGFQQVTKYWSVPGWHQSASVFGVMINKDAWDALSESTREKLKIAADETLLWSLAWSERRSNEGAKAFEDAGVEISRMDDDSLAQIQKIANEVIVESSCESPAAAAVYHSQVSYLGDYSRWRGMSAPFNLGRTPNLPDLKAIADCM